MSSRVELAKIVQSLGWKPFDCQKPWFNSLFGKNRKKYIFVNCPRGTGKTDFGIAALFIQSQLYPDTSLFYIAETEVQAETVVWARMKRMIPKEHIKKEGVKEASHEIHMMNGSIIYLRGSTCKPNSLRGTEPSAVVYDEFRDHSPVFYEAMFGGLRRKGVFMLIISTPPFINEDEKWKLYMKAKDLCEGDAKGAYHTCTCWEGNPDLQEHYKDEQARLLREGREAEFLKEYMAYFVKGVSEVVFPEFNRDSLVPHSDLMRIVRARESDLEWVIGLDTSGWHRWGIMFSAIDRKNKDVYWLDCIVKECKGKSREEREEEGMSGYKLWPEIERKMRELLPNSTHEDWSIVWDYADAPIMDDVNRWYGNDINLIPVDKKVMKKAEGVSLLKDLKLLGKLAISDRCFPIIEEFQCLKINPITGEFKNEAVDLIAASRYQIHLFQDVFDMTELKKDYKPNLTGEEKLLDRVKTKIEQRVTPKTNMTWLEPQQFDDFLEI